MSNVQLEKVYASIVTPEQLLDGGEIVSRSYSYYVGPKKFEILKASGAQKKEIMEFGIFKPICEILLVVMTWINSFIHNYGIAIILLTVIVRVIFWPITHKSTESMKKMQKIQPLVSEIREKYKDKPQKMNQEVMALYKEHKVNPAAGCLPILVQIPVFIALFTVLRSAVELRFAEFLWISDLSEPERLLDFGFTIPVIGWDSLNILPLIMTGVTFVQQKLTPTAGQSQQQKMMALMPVILLVFFYNMPSGLILYWTTSQLIAVAQMGLQRRKAKEEAVSG
jgi:YidC/Oxa1 family membrane protein insertase